LHGFDAAIVEEIASPFVVGRVRGKCGLGDQLECLIIQIELKIASQQEINEYGRSFVVVA